jgi:branched-chain amino acid transport system ATP-binding protein
LAADEPLLALEDIHAGYGDITVLRGVDLTLPPATLTAVIGANGAGKSTLLKTVFGSVRPSAGRILFRGEDVTRLTTVDRLRRGLVLIPQGRSNFPEMTVRENLEMGAFIRTDAEVRGDIDAAYERFPILGERRGQLAGNLSGGEQQMLELAMAFMLTPRLALVDEPSLGLSPALQEEVFQAILRLKDTGAGVLMVEQNAVQALRIADQGVVIELGRVSATGSGVEMLEDPRVRQAYLGLPA